jgi:CheY-like chemotaxis protein
LYVENNLANVRVMERLMRGRGEHLEIAMQGGLAITLARQVNPQIILLDLHLPDMHGSEVVAALLSDPITASVPIVVLSADTSAGGIRRLLDLGATAYLTKPIDMAELNRLLDSLPTRPVAS